MSNIRCRHFSALNVSVYLSIHLLSVHLSVCVNYLFTTSTCVMYVRCTVWCQEYIFTYIYIINCINPTINKNWLDSTI